MEFTIRGMPWEAHNRCRMALWKHYVVLFGGFYDPGLRSRSWILAVAAHEWTAWLTCVSDSPLFE